MTSLSCGLRESKKGGTTAELRVRPQVQGAVVVLDNATGGILAMSGGFSYPLSQLNRATQAARQPGSALKPLTYLAALGKGLQPTTLVSDTPITLPPIGKRKRARADDYWSPGNYDGKSGSTMTLRKALENSRNLATVHVLANGIASSPQAALNEVCGLARELQVYGNCVHFYPFVLGAQPVRPLDLARFYAAIANEGVLPETHVIEKISDQDAERFDYGEPKTKQIKSADPAAFYQLKSILQGVVLRGTAARLSAWAPYVAGKTGTTDEETDAWFVGFSNEVTIAVWVGYDNAKKKQTLGSGRTGGNVAVPIFAPIMEAVWKDYAPRTPLAPPRDAAAQLIAASDTEDKSASRSEESPANHRKAFRDRRVSAQRRQGQGDQQALCPGLATGTAAPVARCPGQLCCDARLRARPALGLARCAGRMGKPRPVRAGLKRRPKHRWTRFKHGRTGRRLLAAVRNVSFARRAHKKGPARFAFARRALGRIGHHSLVGTRQSMICTTLRLDGSTSTT